jgi:5-methylcytosine-specific restriction enzyme A
VARAKLKPCSTPRCGRLTAGGRCDECRRAADRRRGTSSERGYNSAGHRQFRESVLAKHPICQVCLRVAATVADHFPVSRRELLAQGLDPNDPARGRGLCSRCHSSETAQHQPGGWAGSPS